MAGPSYKGYFWKGLGKGFGQGLQWGTQLLNIRAQKKAREDAEKLKEKITLQSQELMTMINEYGPQYTDEEASAIRAFSYASVVEVQDRFKPMLDNIAAGRIKEAEIQMGQIKDYCDYIADLDLTPGQVTQAMDNFRKGGYFTSKGAQDYFDAEERKLKAKVEAREMEPKEPGVELFPSAAGVKEKYPKAGVKYTEKGYVPVFGEPGAPKAPDLPGAIDYLKKFPNPTPEQFNSLKTGAERHYNVDLADVTQESLWKPEKPTPEPKITPPVPTTIENIRRDIFEADTLEDAQRIYDNYVRKYGEEGLMINLPKDWSDTQLGYLINIRTCINNLIDEKGWLKKETLTSAEVGIDFKGDQPVEEIYKKLYEEYKKYREMLEKLGIDVSQFPKLKTLGEIEKVGFWEGALGIKAKGIGIGVQKGQYKSIYYGE